MWMWMPSPYGSRTEYICKILNSVEDGRYLTKSTVYSTFSDQTTPAVCIKHTGVDSYLLACLLTWL